jgi:hypothetical protein
MRRCRDASVDLEAVELEAFSLAAD